MFKLCPFFPLPLYLVATGLPTIQFLFIIQVPNCHTVFWGFFMSILGSSQSHYLSFRTKHCLAIVDEDRIFITGGTLSREHENGTGQIFSKSANGWAEVISIQLGRKAFESQVFVHFSLFLDWCLLRLVSRR
jgi:hypothetical protein